MAEWFKAAVLKVGGRRGVECRTVPLGPGFRAFLPSPRGCPCRLMSPRFAVFRSKLWSKTDAQARSDNDVAAKQKALREWPPAGRRSGPQHGTERTGDSLRVSAGLSNEGARS